LHNIIKYGLAKIVKNYEGKMIGFGDKINDKQIDSVLSYMKSHWDDEIYERQISISK
jgi:mono/diheme cytochrome c family protein